MQQAQLPPPVQPKAKPVSPFDYDPILAKGHQWGYRGNPMIYKEGTQFEWTEDMRNEYIKCMNDPSYFVKNYIKITALERGLVLFEMYGYQEEILQKICGGRFTICKLPRQSGKTTVVVGALLWHLLFNRNYKIAVAANKMEQATEILNRLRLAYERLPKFLQQGLKIWNKRSIEFENLSSIKVGATTSSTIRGGTFNLIYLDEFCHVHKNLQNEFFSGALPAISSGKDTKVVITSTPKGLDLFYRLWMDSIAGKNQYQRIEIDWWDTPGRDEKWKEGMLSQMTETEFDQEFNTAFLGNAGTLINGKKLAILATENPIRKLPSGVKIWKDPVPDHQYVMTVDVSRGLGLDFQAFTCIDVSVNPYEVVATYKNNLLPTMLYHELLGSVGMHYNTAMILTEINDVGQRVVEDLLNNISYENVVMTSIKGRYGGQRAGGGFAGNTRLGIKTSVQTKRVGCANLKQLIERDQLFIKDEDIKYELSTFVQKGTNKYEAEEGCHDDLVMCLVIFSWLIDQQFFKDSISGGLRKSLLSTIQDMTIEDVAPFGIIYDGQTDEMDEDGRVWTDW